MNLYELTLHVERPPAPDVQTFEATTFPGKVSAHWALEMTGRSTNLTTGDVAVPTVNTSKRIHLVSLGLGGHPDDLPSWNLPNPDTRAV